MIMMKNIKKMVPRLKDEIVNEIFKKENNKEKKAKPHIFNNKKNNKECSNLPGLAINTQKELLLFEDTNKLKYTLIKEKRDGIKYPLNKVY